MTLTPPKEFDFLCSKAEALMPGHKLLIRQIRDQYRWAYPASFHPSVGERVNVHSGGSDPTSSVAGNKESFRQELAKAIRQLEDIVSYQENLGESLKAIRGRMQIPENRAKLEYDTQDKSAEVGPGYLDDMREAKRKREERGESYGEG